MLLNHFITLNIGEKDLWLNFYMADLNTLLKKILVFLSFSSINI